MGAGADELLKISSAPSQKQTPPTNPRWEALSSTNNLGVVIGYPLGKPYGDDIPCRDDILREGGGSASFLMKQRLPYDAN